MKKKISQEKRGSVQYSGRFERARVQENLGLDN